ncbi:glycerate kinase [Pelomonas sp. KK5]|uniref:glycerate kinase type-2 family protein n=1 Tax=Pelomonas sp. KK5 TaxID=1855730 RepID=UPI00097C0A15|nr:glycerate kinase [Pelomonas sp. KK5]
MGKAPELLRAMFDAAVAAAQPALCLPPLLRSIEPPRGRLVVIGAGKASAAMARAVDEHWEGPLSGVVVTRYGYGVGCRRIEILEAAHPVPDAAGETASRRILDAVQGLTPDDLVLCLISGGGSSLLPLPLPGLTLADKQALNEALLASGATIREMNCVRRHLSAIKGGRLAAACRPARVVNLLLSDVPGDDPIDIASGPTVPDPSTAAEALAILDRYGITLPVRHLLAETIKPGDPRLPEARDVARALAGIALQVARRGQPFTAPCILLSGGETTVTVRGDGRGGRNVEFLLSLALALDGQPGIQALAADTDGVDGQEEIAGALLAPDTLARAHALGIHPRERLDANDGHGFFETLGDSLVTGPTLTNVNDFRAILITAP